MKELYYLVPTDIVLKYQYNIEGHNRLEFRQTTNGDFVVNISVQEDWLNIDWDSFQVIELTPEDFKTNSSIA